MNDERILTMHPKGKKGVNILKVKYDQIRIYILGKIKVHTEISFQDLSDMASVDLKDAFDGKVLWYIVTVKLDLEARGIIERVPRKSPHELRMTK